MNLGEAFLESLYLDAEMCTNCCIAESTQTDHVDCAGPQGYACDCYCNGQFVDPSQHFSPEELIELPTNHPRIQLGQTRGR